jgi:hypothetical protein
MKAFHLLPTSKTHGVLYDGDKASAAVFINPREAKFMAAFKTVRSAVGK